MKKLGFSSSANFLHLVAAAMPRTLRGRRIYYTIAVLLLIVYVYYNPIATEEAQEQGDVSEARAWIVHILIDTAFTAITHHIGRDVRATERRRG